MGFFTPINPTMRRRYRRQMALPFLSCVSLGRERNMPPTPHLTIGGICNGNASRGEDNEWLRKSTRCGKCPGQGKEIFSGLFPIRNRFGIISLLERKRSSFVHISFDSSKLQNQSDEHQRQTLPIEKNLLLYFSLLMCSIPSLLIVAQEVVGSASELLSTMSLHHRDRSHLH